MKKAKDSIRNKEIIALILIIVLFFLIRFALLYIGARLSETRENELIQLKMNALTDIVSDASEKRAAASERVSEKLAANTRLMAAIRRELPAEGGGTGEDTARVNAMREKEAETFLDHYNEPIYEILESTDDSFGGVTLLVSEENGSLHIERQFGTSEGLEKLSDGDLTADMLQPSAVLTLNEREYHCSAAALEGSGSGGENRYVVQMIPKVSLSDQNVSRALLIVLVMVIILAAVTVYVTSAQRFTADHGLPDEKTAHYHPDNVRRRMVTVGILSVLAVFAVALLVESVGQLVMELRYGRDTLRLFTGQVQKESQEQIKSLSEEEASWYIWYGEELASVLAEHPELATAENLQEYCDLLQIDYLMLFDSEGNETACNRDYVGFTLGDGPEDALYDFRRLLHGVPNIVHEVSLDAETGLERQMIGVKVPSSESGSMHGALLMALLPDSTGGAGLTGKRAGMPAMETARGTNCFAADAGTGEILYAGNAAMVGKTIREYNLPDNSLQDGYMDFTPLNGTRHLVLTVREGERVYYYAVESGTVFEQVLLYAVLAALLFALILVLLLVFLLKGYNQKACDEWIEIRARENERERSLPSRDGETAEKASEKGKNSEKDTGLLKKLLALLGWDQKKPGQRAVFILHVGIIILILCCLDVLNKKGLSIDQYDTLFGFLLNGDWMRGLNLFSLCSCLIIIAIAYLVNIFSSLLLKLTGLIFAGQGETICRLLYSCIKYITVLGGIYFCLEYLGFPTSTILTALASVSLAISLGAQDLIADILAGLAIVFDGSFHVGDVVEINGRKGTVLELGVRATRMRIPVNNILTINNHEIKDVLNLSKECSECLVFFRVSMEEPLAKLEGILARELPAIGEKDGRILFGPYLLGVADLPNEKSMGPVYKLSVGAMCDEKDEEEIGYLLKKEVKLLAEREGIGLF